MIRRTIYILSQHIFACIVRVMKYDYTFFFQALPLLSIRHKLGGWHHAACNAYMICDNSKDGHPSQLHLHVLFTIYTQS